MKFRRISGVARIDSYYVTENLCDEIRASFDDSHEYAWIRYARTNFMIYGIQILKEVSRATIARNLSHNICSDWVVAFQ